MALHSIQGCNDFPSEYISGGNSAIHSNRKGSYSLSQSGCVQLVEEAKHINLVDPVHTKDLVFVSVVFAETGDSDIAREGGLEIKGFAAVRFAKDNIALALGDGVDERFNILGIFKKHHGK